MKNIPIQASALVGVLVASAATAVASDYAPAIWRPCCNANWYTSGYGHKFCVIHDMEGYYMTTISYLTSCSHTTSSVYYAVNGLTDSSDNGAPPGEISQMVSEANYAWHACCWNQYAFGTEHEGFASNPAWYTAALYQASAGLQLHLCNTYGIAKDRNHIVAHGEKSNANWVAWAPGGLGINPSCNSHTDPGPYWDWPRFMNMITSVTLSNRVGMARTPSGNGYWIAASDGGVFSFGDATFYGSMGGQHLNAPVVGICARPQGDGYWMVASDGGIFSFGSAPFEGSMGGQHLNKPVCGMACTQSGNGYWLVGQDGGIFNFGDAAMYGSLGSAGYTDITCITPAWKSDKSNGYRIIRSNGCSYDYNCSHLAGGLPGSQVYASCTTGADNGFWEVMSGGGAVYSFGNAVYHGGNNPSSNIFIGMDHGPSATGGYWLLDNTGAIFSYGDAPFKGGANFH